MACFDRKARVGYDSWKTDRGRLRISHTLKSIKRLWHKALGTQIIELDGVRVNTGRGKLPGLARNLIYKGTYEAPERQLVLEALSPGNRVLEIGTGIGFISLLCARLVGERNVLSYEANPDLKAVIQSNYELNGLRPHLEMKAVTIDGDPVDFYQNGNIISSSLISRDLETKKIKVESDAIAEVVSRHDPDVIIMDVEGAEVELLPAADLRNVNTVIVEFHPHIVGRDRINALKATLRERGLHERKSIKKNSLFKR